MKLYHYSEDPAVAVFHPHIAKTSRIRHEDVWAIDEWHSPMNYVPRDCPRACFWAGERTTAVDRDWWLHGLEPRFVIAVEAGWLERMRSTVLYRYEMPSEKFTPRLDDIAGTTSAERLLGRFGSSRCEICWVQSSPRVSRYALSTVSGRCGGAFARNRRSTFPARGFATLSDTLLSSESRSPCRTAWTLDDPPLKLTWSSLTLETSPLNGAVIRHALWPDRPRSVGPRQAGVAAA